MSGGVRIFPVVAVTLMVLMVAASVALLSGVPHSMPSAPSEGIPDQHLDDISIEPLNLPVGGASATLSALRDGNAFAPLKQLAPPAPTTVAGHELRGTVVNDDGGFALLAKPGAEAVVVVGRGDTLGGWKLIGLATNRAIFEKNGRQLVLRLSF